jgi:hypothetical protein
MLTTLETRRILEEVGQERTRQISANRYDASHDDGWTKGQLAEAAAVYAVCALPERDHLSVLWWPWGTEFFKPLSHRENLVRSAAMIIAEIERLDRDHLREIANLERER